MLSRLLVEDRDQISDLLRQIAPEEVYLAVPNFTPTARMMDYELYRASYGETMQLRGYLRDWGLDEEAELERFERGYSRRILNRLWERKHLRKMPQPEECFLSVHGDLGLFYGNSGAERGKLGDLRTMTSQDVIDCLEGCEANYNCASYCFDPLPNDQAFLHYVEGNLRESFVYPDADSFVSYWLMQMEAGSARLSKMICCGGKTNY